ncbi:SIS domain-containing protein [Microbacterium gorillae]|uniref:SIS domain-containing protein n=1 Tax=Microbacterium gorillae TaxID=1231063 RepID=UPI00058FEAFF|nr:hypothetical protein [Microbacterium gorillae]
MAQKIPFADAMRAQPALIAGVLRRLREAPAVPPLRPTEVVSVVGMGASRNSAYAFVAAARAAGVRAANPSAAEVQAGPGDIAPADYTVLVSESGRSPETVSAARLPARVSLAVTNEAGSPLAAATDVSLDFGDIADSGVYTAGYLATLLAYAHLFDAWGLDAIPPDVEQLPFLVAEALQAHEEDARAAAEWIAAATIVDVVGQQVSFAAASQFGLMLREGPRVRSAVFETFEYLHGPIDAARDGTVVVAFGDGREADLARVVVGGGARAVLVTSDEVESSAALRVIRIPTGLSPFARAAVEAVVAQLIAAAAAEIRGVSMDEFLYDGLGTKIGE